MRGRISTGPFLALAAAVAVHVLLCFLWRGDFFYDATHVYLPHARRLLGEGLGFLADERSVWAPFLTYAYPALLGANVPLIMAVNLVLSCATVLLVHGIAVRAGSARAGLAAAWIYAVSAPVVQVVLNVSTETPFLFFCALWLWSFARLEETRLRRFAWIGGIALALAANTRASILPFAYASALLALVACAFRGPRRSTWVNLALMQGIAVALVMVVVVKNGLLFGLFQLSTGGGNALYLGNHTLTGGYEPFYGGLFFDVTEVAHGNHLSLHADRVLREAGWQMVQAQSLPALAQGYGLKIAAFFFYANAVIDDSFFTLRSWRIVLLALSLVTLLRGWRNPVVLLATAVAASLAAVHVPVPYNPRYSEGSLELWLAVLAGCGVATVTRWRWQGIACFVLVVLALCYAGKTIRHLEGPVAPLRFSAAVPHRIAWQMTPSMLLDAPPVTTGEPPVLSAARPALRVRVPDVDGFAGNVKYGQRNFFLLLDVSPVPSTRLCAKGRIAFVPEAYAAPIVPEAYYPLRLDTSAPAQTFAFGIARATPTWQVPLDGPGTLTLSFNCAPGEAVRVDRFAIAEATHGEAYGRAPDPPPANVPIVEYYNPSLDHYFITWVPDEIAVLDASTGPRGWLRTGQVFAGYHLPQGDRGILCRFYAPPGKGDTHFVGFGPAECAALERSHPDYVREARDHVVRMLRPVDGRCAEGTTPVFRLRNPKGHQRFVTDTVLRDGMLAKGWRAEGAPGVATMCAPR